LQGTKQSLQRIFNQRYASVTSAPLTGILGLFVTAAAQLPRGLVLFVLIQKVPKKSSQQKCFFAALGLRRTKQQKPWAVPTIVGTMPCPAAPPCRFFLLSPEAYLLTDRK